MSLEIQVPIISLPAELEGAEVAEMINFSALCRICGSQNNRLINLYSQDSMSNDIPGKINLYLPIKVTENDHLPLHCCWQCLSTLVVWHELFVKSVETDQKLRSCQFISEKQYVDMTSAFEATNQILAVSAEETLDANEASKPTPDASTVEESESEEITPKEETATQNCTCNICKKVFEQKSLLSKHITKTHLKMSPRKRGKKHELTKNFQCNLCEKSYTKKHDLSRHQQRKHGIKPISQTSRTVNQDILNLCQVRGSNLYKCDICEKCFNKSYNLLRHRTVHSGQKRYSCSRCGKSFRLNMSLTRHIKEVHNDTRQVECDKCGTSFKNKWSLQQHYYTHQDSKQYVCDICGKSFKQRAGLFVHKQYHKDFCLKCHVCGKGFKKKHNLDKHVQVHSGHRKFMCSKCEEIFRTKVSLDRHMARCHLKLSCERCGCDFEQKRYLKLHLKGCNQELEKILKIF